MGLHLIECKFASKTGIMCEFDYLEAFYASKTTCNSLVYGIFFMYFHFPKWLEISEVSLEIFGGVKLEILGGFARRRRKF